MWIQSFLFSSTQLSQVDTVSTQQKWQPVTIEIHTSGWISTPLARSRQSRQRQRFVSHTLSVHFVEKKSFHMFTEENMFIIKTQ